jgi:hypothetical protein
MVKGDLDHLDSPGLGAATAGDRTGVLCYGGVQLDGWAEAPCMGRVRCVRRGLCIWRDSFVGRGSCRTFGGHPCGQRGLGPCLPLLGCGDCRVEIRRSYKSKRNTSTPPLTVEPQPPQTHPWSLNFSVPGTNFSEQPQLKYTPINK